MVAFKEGLSAGGMFYAQKTDDEERLQRFPPYQN